MNKTRRKELYALIGELNSVGGKEDLDSCISTLDTIKFDEEEYYDNAPENLQYSWRYEMSREAISNMEEALDYLGDAQSCEDEDEFQDYIDDAIACIEDATA